MSTDDTDRALTRRQALQGAGGAAASAAVFPLKHNPDDGGGGLLSKLFGGEADIVVTDEDGNVIAEDPDEFRFAGSAVKAIEEVGHPDSTIVRVTLRGGSGGGAFEDTDGDGVAELQDDHVDMQGGDVLNGRNMGAAGNPMGTAYVTSIDGDGDAVGIGPSVSTDQLLTESRGPTVVIRDDAGTFVADGPDGELASGTDAGVVIDAVLTELSPDGGHIHFAEGTFTFDTAHSNDWSESVTVTGAGRGATRLKPTTSISHLFNVKKTGGTVNNAPTFSGFMVERGDLLSVAAIDVDSATQGVIHSVRIDNGGTLVHSSVDEASKNAEQWTVAYCRGTNGGQIAKLEAGSSGTHDLWTFKACYSFGLSGWGIEALDGVGTTVEDVGAFNNAGTFDGAVRVAATGSGAGAQDVEAVTINRVSLENQDGMNNAEAVVVENAGGTDNTVSNVFVREIKATPSNAITYVRVENKDATANRVRQVRIREFRNNPTHANAVQILGTNGGVRDNSVTADRGFIANSLRDIVSDGGTRTRLNGQVYAALGGAPDATDYETGVIVHDTNNAGDAYLVYGTSASTDVTQIGT